VWPHRFLDLSPLDFFYRDGGGDILRKVSTSSVTQNTHELKILVRDACESDSVEMLSNVANETHCSFDVCESPMRIILKSNM